MGGVMSDDQPKVQDVLGKDGCSSCYGRGSGRIE